METVRAGLSVAEEWLWEDWKLADYQAKIKELKTTMAGASLRKYELEHRPEYVKKAHEQIDSINLALANETFMAEVTVNDTKLIVDSTKEFAQWLATKEDAQKGKKMTERPAFLAADIYDEMEIHRQTVSQALRPKPNPKAKRKPKAKKSKKKKKAKKKTTDGDDAKADGGKKDDGSEKTKED